MLLVETAACLAPDGTIYTLPRPARHHDVLKHIIETGVHNPRKCTQGFVLSDGTFASRKRAKIIAIEADQLLKDPDTANGLSQRVSTSDELYSECIFDGTLYNFNPTIDELQTEIERQRVIIYDLSRKLRSSAKQYMILRKYVKTVGIEFGL